MNQKSMGKRKKMSEAKQPRDGYRELLYLTIILLGGTPETGIGFRKSEAYHRARRIAKVIFQKIFIFKSQFIIISKEEREFKNIRLFSVSIYIG